MTKKKTKIQIGIAHENADMRIAAENKAKKLESYVTIVVLNDGETFTDITGCTIQTIATSDYYRVVDVGGGGDARDFTPASVIRLGVE